MGDSWIGAARSLATPSPRRYPAPGGFTMPQTAQTRTFETVGNEAERVFKLQREAYLRQPYPSYEERLEHLRKLEGLLVDNARAMADAITQDFGHRALGAPLMVD